MMDGILNIYKTQGMTSFDVVRVIKRLTNTKKVGHTGTLDPLACGVLPICIGKATKLVDFIMNDFKVYRATLKLGLVTDTYDREGKILNEKEINFGNEEVIEIIHSFKGEINQIPPMYSAIKVNGKRLYELARKGIEVERKSREVTIYDIKILKINLPYVEFDVKCSKGTYIRSLCYDIGEKLGCGAVMWDLERTATGMFSKENSITLEELTKENIGNFITPIDEALYMYKKVYFEKSYQKLLENGVSIKNEKALLDVNDEELYRVYIKNNHFIGLGRRNEQGFKIVKLLVQE